MRLGRVWIMLVRPGAQKPRNGAMTALYQRATRRNFERRISWLGLCRSTPKGLKPALRRQLSVGIGPAERS